MSHPNGRGSFPPESNAALDRPISRLRSLLLPDGGCPYYKGGERSVEATLLASLALLSAGFPGEPVKSSLSWIQTLQNADGSVGIGSDERGQGLWLTAPAAVVFHHCGLEKSRDGAVAFLLALKSVTLEKDPKLKQDNTLVGWPWVAGTFGWVEPTAWSLMALRLSGLGLHARAAEGVRFLLDRQIPSGGWNYGNPALDDRNLLPFWDTTGLALAALSGTAPAAKVRPSLDLLTKKQDEINSLCGLAWAAIGLQAYEREAARIRARLRDVMDSIADDSLHAGHFSAGLIALSGKKVYSL